MNLRRLILISWLAPGLAACTGLGPGAGLLRLPSPHDRYGESLKAAKLDQTALGIDWLAAGERALRDSLKITVPYRESGYFSASKAFAIGYRLDAQRGDRFLIRVDAQGEKPLEVFIDVVALEGRRSSPVAALRADTNALAWEPRRTQTYLIRIQPELLRSGRYTFSITRQPALSFPVKGLDSRHIVSYFGTPRDGGRRRHEGVDVFAPQGTPAIASVNGIVTGIGTNAIGGNVAFLSDQERRIRLYYAHLAGWHVRNGQHVSVGDTIGFVGNTGNARTTGPHLHFGIYDFDARATDPLPYIRAGRGPARQTLLTAARLGDSLRVQATRTALRTAPSADAPVLRELPKASALTVMGGTAAWLRVELPDGLTGYVASAATEPATRPLRMMVLTAPGNLLDAAYPTAPTIDRLPAGSAVAVLAQGRAFLLVRKSDGQTGWLAAPEGKTRH